MIAPAACRGTADRDPATAPAGEEAAPAGREMEGTDLLVQIIFGVIFVLLVTSAWAFICTGSQKGWMVALKFIAWAIIFGAFVANAWKQYVRPIGTWVALGLLLSFAWLAWAGSYHRTRDLLCMGFSFGAVMLLLPRGRLWLKSLYAVIRRSLCILPLRSSGTMHSTTARPTSYVT